MAEVTRADRLAAYRALDHDGRTEEPHPDSAIGRWLDGKADAVTHRFMQPDERVAQAIADARAPTVASAELLSLQAGRDQPWPLRDCVAKLVEAADILLHQHDYDGTHWELIQSAWTHAKGYLDAPAVASAELEADMETLRHAVRWWAGGDEDVTKNGTEGRALSRIAAALGVKP